MAVFLSIKHLMQYKALEKFPPMLAIVTKVKYSSSFRYPWASSAKTVTRHLISSNFKFYKTSPVTQNKAA